MMKVIVTINTSNVYLAAMGGDGITRHNLGHVEIETCNMDRALKHYMIAVRDGNKKSLDSIKELYSRGYATKDDYTKALRSYQDIWERLRVFRGMMQQLHIRNCKITFN